MWIDLFIHPSNFQFIKVLISHFVRSLNHTKPNLIETNQTEPMCIPLLYYYYETTLHQQFLSSHPSWCPFNHFVICLSLLNLSIDMAYSRVHTYIHTYIITYICKPTSCTHTTHSFYAVMHLFTRFHHFSIKFMFPMAI